MDLLFIIVFSWVKKCFFQFSFMDLHRLINLIDVCPKLVTDLLFSVFWFPAISLASEIGLNILHEISWRRYILQIFGEKIHDTPRGKAWLLGGTIHLCRIIDRWDIYKWVIGRDMTLTLIIILFHCALSFWFIL